MAFLEGDIFRLFSPIPCEFGNERELLPVLFVPSIGVFSLGAFSTSGQGGNPP